jgi:hypothetical protein
MYRTRLYTPPHNIKQMSPVTGIDRASAPPRMVSTISCGQHRSGAPREVVAQYVGILYAGHRSLCYVLLYQFQVTGQSSENVITMPWQGLVSRLHPRLEDSGPETTSQSPCTRTLHIYATPAPWTLHSRLHIPHPTSCTLQPTAYTLYPAPYILHPTAYSLYPIPRTLHRLHIPHPTSCTLQPTAYTLYPAAYTPHPKKTPHPTPYILHPTAYTLYPIPHTLHPAPCTLYPRTPHPFPYIPHQTLHTPHSISHSPYSPPPPLRGCHRKLS